MFIQYYDSLLLFSFIVVYFFSRIPGLYILLEVLDISAGSSFHRGFMLLLSLLQGRLIILQFCTVLFVFSRIPERSLSPTLI